MVKWEGQAENGRITCEMKVHESLMDIGHCECFEVNTFLWLIKLELCRWLI